MLLQQLLAAQQERVEAAVVVCMHVADPYCVEVQDALRCVLPAEAALQLTHGVLA
jgi:hypothetical protein